MYYIPFLQSVHDLLRPKAYLEIGVRLGKSLATADCRAVGIDPDYEITVPIDGDIALFRTTSDEYFSRPRPLDATGGQPFDLTFIDGLHLFEFALRDFINAERHSSAGSAVIFDDVLPRSVDEAARQRHTVLWTGDVYPILEVLARYRPDLSVIPVGTKPTGLLLIVGLDPSNQILVEKYDEIMSEFRRADPQPVPPEVLERLAVLPPQRVLESSLWDVLRKAAADSKPEEIRSELAAAVERTLGKAFVPSPAPL